MDPEKKKLPRLRDRRTEEEKREQTRRDSAAIRGMSYDEYIDMLKEVCPECGWSAPAEGCDGLCAGCWDCRR